MSIPMKKNSYSTTTAIVGVQYFFFLAALTELFSIGSNITLVPMNIQLSFASLER